MGGCIRAIYDIQFLEHHTAHYIHIIFDAKGLTT
jgi:hypothetical protein